MTACSDLIPHYDKQKKTGGRVFQVATCKSFRHHPANTQLLLAIKDNGLGIPVTIKDKIFQPFFTTKPTGQGTGLGLSLSHDIVKAHGGTIEVESQPAGQAGVEREGTTFILKLPIQNNKV